MAGKSNTLSKKTIIAIIAIIILLIIAGFSVGLFLADKGSTEAVDGGETVGQSEQPGEDAQTPVDEENNDGEQQPGEQESEEPTTPEQPGEETPEAPVDNEEQPENPNEQQAGNAGETNTEITTGTDVNEVGETTVTRVEEVARDYWDWWMPASVVVASTTANIDATTPNFDVIKETITEAGENVVYAGEKITYKITVKNNGTQDLNEIEISDRIPENTTYVVPETTPENLTEVKENGEVIGLKWIVTVPAGEEAVVEFTVTVDEATEEAVIRNTAIANGEESNETATAIITSEKSSIITRDDKEVEIAKVGDLITYKITVKNTMTSGEAELLEEKYAVKDILDTVPAGTEFVSAQEGANVSTQDGVTTIKWENVEIKPGEEASREFTVRVTNIDGEIKNIATVGGEETNEDETPTADIKVEKTVSDIKRNGESIGKDAKVQAGDVIEYNIVVTNTGSVDLTNVVVDEQLEGIEVNAEDLQIGDLSAGESKTIIATYTVTHEKDIQGKPEQVIYNKAVVTGETPVDPEEPTTPEEVEDEDDEETPVEETPGINIEKEATAVNGKTITETTKVRPGDVVEYTITVQNTGNTTLENIVVTDSLKVTVNGEIKEIDETTKVSTIATIASLAPDAQPVEIKAYYTVTENDTANLEKIYNVATVTVPEGPSDEDKDDKVPVNPDTSVSGTKTWVDGGRTHNNAEDVKLTLTRMANGKTEIVNVTPTWDGATYTFSKLPTYDADGFEYTYKVTETRINGYEEPEYDGNNITNTITDPADVVISGTKTWVDGEIAHNNAEDVKLTLTRTANGKEETVNVTPTWEGNTYTFSGLDRYDAEGYEYTYKVTEAQVNGYEEPEYDGNNITNTIADPADVEVSGTKTWVDGGKEHDNAEDVKLTLTRMANGKTEILNETPTWDGATYTFSGLDRYDEEGYVYTYKVIETQVNGYEEPKYDGNNITNTITDPKDVEISGTKTWVDGGKEHNNAEDVILILTRTANGKEETVNVTPTWNENTYTFSGLDKYDENGYEYTYKVTESPKEGYHIDYSGNDITNTIIDPADVEVSGTKTWVDGGKEHDNATQVILTLRRIANGKEEIVSSIPTWEGNTYTFSGLDKYDEDGYVYTYKVTETQVNGYEEPVYDTENPNNITNTIIDPADVVISGTKTWIDGGISHDNADEITLILTRTSAKPGSEAEVVEATPTWEGNTYTFSGLDKYDAEGYEYTYTVTEAPIDGYTTSITGNNITNTIIDPENVVISGTKTWIDGGISHDNADEITLTLTRKANGKTETVNVTPTWEGNTYTFSGLDRYDEDGYVYEYEVTETPIEGYTTSISDNDIINTIIDPADVVISGTKTWVDGGKDHNNAEDVILTLTRTSAKEGSEAEVVEVTPVWNENTYTFNGLDRYDEEGYEYTYQVTETPVNGYTTSITGNNITNTIIDPADVEISGTKTWVDGGKDHNNAEDVILTLTREANGKTETVNVTPTWEGNTYTFSGLDRYDAEGYEYTYKVTETQVAGYDIPVYDTENPNNITNTITDPEDVVITGTKTWVDGGKDHNNAEEITLVLTRIANEKTETVNATPVWEGNTYTFSGLDKYDENGYEYTYKVTETQVEGYNIPEYDEVNPNNITNTISDSMDKTISGRKIWIDGGKEHNNIKDVKLKLTRKSKNPNSIEETVNVIPTWDGNIYTFSGLAKYDAEGYEYEYTVTEAQVNGYEEPVYQNNTITNKIADLKDVEISGTKTWIDGGKQHNNAEDVKLTLTRISAKPGSEAEVVEATPTWEGNTYTFSGLDRYDEEGYAYTYKVTEISVNGYTTSISGNDITNTIIDPADVEISGTKTWVDGGKDHNNAKEITLVLTRTSTKPDSEAEVVEVTPVWNGNTYTFSGLDRYDEEGYAYKYEVTETQVAGYDTPVYDKENPNNITNTITDPADVEISGTKTWVDGEKDHNNAEEITLVLTRTSTKPSSEAEVVEVTPVWNGNTYTFSGLDRYDEEGYAYKYEVTETQVAGYDTPVYDKENPNNITNKITDPADVEISGTKTWVDGGKDHNNAEEITLVLTRTANEKTETVSATPTWEGNTYTFSGLDKYDVDGYEYKYNVTEIQINGYDVEYSENNITNTIIDPANVVISGTKTWIDGGKEHDNATEVKLTLTRTSAKPASEAEVVEATPVWNENTYTFSGLDQYDEEGYAYTYTVIETPVAGYQTSSNGNSITNTIIDPADVVISGTKTWIDGGKQHNNAREIILTLTRKANGKTETVNVTPTWEGNTYTFSGLDRYDENGYEYTYKVTETQVPGYDTPVYDTENPNNITNTITDPMNVEIRGTKTWIDNGNAYNTRPENITVNLMRNGVQIKSATVSAETNWSYEFTGLEKYDENGYEYTYTISEVSVEGYKTTVSGNNITNELTGTINIPVTKVWEDYDNSYDARTNGISVTLKANGSAKQTVTITESTEWKHTFENLPKYQNGVAINYTVTEAPVEGYQTTITGDSTTGFTITNTYNNVTINKKTLTSVETQKAKVDVVFVLDVSGSMVQNKVNSGNYGQKITRAEAMVNATNKAISAIMSKNSENRVGVVMYSEGVTTALDLGKYTAKNTGKYLNYSEYTFWGETSATITTNVNELRRQASKDVTGGTYTQLGIATGANLLANATNTEGRTPVLIVLTDGEPTFGTSNYNNVTTRYNIGSGSDTNEVGDIGYMTVLTANYYKGKINDNYKTEENPSVAQIYTIGIGMEGAFNKALLDPSSTNVNACRYGDNDAQELYNYLTGNNSTIKVDTSYNGWTGNLEDYREQTIRNPYKDYDYADGSYTGQMDEEQLAEILDKIVSSIKYYNTTTTYTTNINTDPAMVELENLDINEKIIIKLDNVATPEEGISVSDLMADGTVVLQQGRYYMDLNASRFENVRLIDITYCEVSDIQ